MKWVRHIWNWLGGPSEKVPMVTDQMIKHLSHVGAPHFKGSIRPSDPVSEKDKYYQ